MIDQQDLFNRIRAISVTMNQVADLIKYDSKNELNFPNKFLEIELPAWVRTHRRLVDNKTKEMFKILTNIEQLGKDIIHQRSLKNDQEIH